MGMLRVVLLAESLLLLLLVLPALPPAMAAVFSEPVGDPDHPGTCFIREKGIRVRDGVTWDLPGCMGAACYGTGEDMTIEYYTCGSIAVPDHCFISEDKSKPYPECCGDIFCPPPAPRAERSAHHP